MATSSIVGAEIRGFQVNTVPADFSSNRDLPEGFVDFLRPLHQKFVARRNELVEDRAIDVFLSGQASLETRQTLEKQMSDPNQGFQPPPPPSPPPPVEAPRPVKVRNAAIGIFVLGVLVLVAGIAKFLPGLSTVAPPLACVSPSRCCRSCMRSPVPRRRRIRRAGSHATTAVWSCRSIRSVTQNLYQGRGSLQALPADAQWIGQNDQNASRAQHRTAVAAHRP